MASEQATRIDTLDTTSLRVQKLLSEAIQSSDRIQNSQDPRIGLFGPLMVVCWAEVDEMTEGLRHQLQNEEAYRKACWEFLVKPAHFSYRTELFATPLLPAPEQVTLYYPTSDPLIMPYRSTNYDFMKGSIREAINKNPFSLSVNYSGLGRNHTYKGNDLDKLIESIDLVRATRDILFVD